MKRLDLRIDRLEKAAGMQDDGLCVIIRCCAEGELAGYRLASHGQASVETIRQPGESEAGLLERAKASVSVQNGWIVLRELRSDAQ